MLVLVGVTKVLLINELLPLRVLFVVMVVLYVVVVLVDGEFGFFQELIKESPKL